MNYVCDTNENVTFNRLLPLPVALTLQPAHLENVMGINIDKINFLIWWL